MKLNIGKPAVMKAKVSSNTFEMKDKTPIEMPKPVRTLVQGPDLNVRAPEVGVSNPNNEPVLPFGYRGYFLGG